MEDVPIDASEYYSVRNGEEFDAIKLRLYEATGCMNMHELAHVLGTTAAHISDARRRLRMPEIWFQTVFLKTLTHPTWLKEGKGRRIFPLRG